MRESPRAFEGALSISLIQQALEECRVEFRDRIYSPWMTLWAFLAQILSSIGSGGEGVQGATARTDLSDFKQSLGFRVQKIEILTTLLDSKEYTAEELGNLYFRRCRGAMYLDDIQTMLGLDVPPVGAPK